MPNIKRIGIDTAEGTGLTVYALVRREADGYLLDDATGEFGLAPADPYRALSEHAVLKGRYEASESRTEWTDGAYTVAAYLQSGGSPAPASDTLVGTGAFYIREDAEVLLDASVATRATAGDFLGELAPGVFQNMVRVTDGGVQGIVRGDAGTITLNAGAGWDFTAKRVFFMAKADPLADNTTAIVDREATVTDAVGGVAEITLTSAETALVGRYYAEFEQRDLDGTGNPLTVMQFTLLIRQDVRQ